MTFKILKSIYEIKVLKYLGGKYIEEKLKKNYLLLTFMCLGLSLIIFLSNVIVNMEIIHQDREIRELVKSSLEKYGISKYSLKKDYDELEKIEAKILKENKERLEWLEISLYGTKYIVRIEERKINDKKEETGYQHIVSKKDAVLVKVDAISGDKLKNVNEYVKKGEVVISGYVTKPDNSKVLTSAIGKIYGEVWYEVDIDYPIVYQETNYTGKSHTTYAIYFFDRRISIPFFDNYKTSISKQKVLLKSNFLNIKLTREKIKEVIIKDEVYTEDIARVKALDYVKNKLTKDNNSLIEIKDIKILSTLSDYDSVKMNLFIKVVEDITSTQLIEEKIEGDDLK